MPADRAISTAHRTRLAGPEARAYSPLIDKTPTPTEPTMTHHLTHRFAALGFAAMVTFAMLGSMNVLATQPHHDAEFAQALVDSTRA